MKREEEWQELKSLWHSPELIEDRLVRNDKTYQRAQRWLCIFFGLMVAAILLAKGIQGYMLAIPVLYMLVAMHAVRNERKLLLLMKVLQEEKGAPAGRAKEKGEREKQAVAEPCAVNSEVCEIVIPSVGEMFDSCSIACWHVADGASVKKGDTLVTLETDKVTSELEAENDGILRHKVKEGEAAKVGEVIGWIE